MIPPSPPAGYKPASPGFSSRPHAVLLSPVRGRPQEAADTAPLLRPEKRPEVHLIKRPDGGSGQGHVHTEILVHHKPETINLRPQPAPHPSVHSHVHSAHQPPPRRVEVSAATEVPHRYIFLGKPDSNGNEIALSTNWKSDKKPVRFALNNRPRPRPVLRATTSRPLDRHVFVERPTGFPAIRIKPTYSGPPRPPIKAQAGFTLAHRPQSHQESTRVPPQVYTLQTDHQSGPLQIYPDKTNGVAPNAPVEQSDHVPTGAIEYHNPLHLIPDEGKHPQVSTARPQHTSPDHAEKWPTNTPEQTSSLDSDIGASEYNYQNRYHGNKSQETVDDRDEEHAVDPAYPQSVNQTLRPQTSYETVSVNTVVGKPLEAAQEHGVIFGDKPSGTLQGPHSDPYNTRPYDLPIVQGKPFGVYNGYVDPTVPYGHKLKEGKLPDYEIVHGIPAAYDDDAKPTKKTQEGQSTTLNSLERDDTIDLKPPAIISQFGGEADRPGRPFARPIRPDARPVLYVKPEILTKPPIKLEVRPEYGAKRPVVKPNAADTFANQTLSMKINHDLQNWNVDATMPDIVKSQQKISEIKAGENKNSTAPSRPLGGKRPGAVQRPEHGTFTRVHPDYPHILTKPKPQVPDPVIISSGNANLDAHGRPTKFSMSVEATGEEVDSKTQTERPPSMLITKNNPSHKRSNETLETAYQTNFASLDHQDKTRPVNVKEVNVPSRNIMPPPLNVGSNQSNKNEQGEGLKPPPPPSDVLGLSPPPVDITTTHVPIEDRFALVTSNESGLKPPKFVPLKESTTAPPPPSTNMVPPSPRPSLTRPFLVELLSQVRLDNYLN